MNVCIGWCKWFCQFVPSSYKGKWQLGRDVTQIARLWRTAIMPWIKDVLLNFVPVWEQREKIQAKIHITLYYRQNKKGTFVPSYFNPTGSLFELYSVFYFFLDNNRSESKIGGGGNPNKNKKLVATAQRKKGDPPLQILPCLLVPYRLIYGSWWSKMPNKSPRSLGTHLTFKTPGNVTPLTLICSLLCFTTNLMMVMNYLCQTKF